MTLAWHVFDKEDSSTYPAAGHSVWVKLDSEVVRQAVTDSTFLGTFNIIEGPGPDDPDAQVVAWAYNQ